MKSICSSRNIITSQFLSCWVGTLSHYSFMVFLIWVICSVLSLYKCSNSSFFFFLKVLQGGYPQVELLRFFKCLSAELWITVSLWTSVYAIFQFYWQRHGGWTWGGGNLSSMSASVSTLGDSGWLIHVQSILAGSAWIAARIALESASVLVHCRSEVFWCHNFLDWSLLEMDKNISVSAQKSLRFWIFSYVSFAS